MKRLLPTRNRSRPINRMSPSVFPTCRIMTPRATQPYTSPAGSTEISAKDKEALTELAHSAVNLTGYIVQVKGFADTSGNAAMNQKLSMERAQEVVAFLLQNCNVPLRHIVAPGAMGEADPAAPNETAEGRAENRRVEVKVLVNRGLLEAIRQLVCRETSVCDPLSMWLCGRANAPSCAQWLFPQARVPVKNFNRICHVTN